MNCERDIRFELLARLCPNSTGMDTALNSFYTPWPSQLSTEKKRGNKSMSFRHGITILVIKMGLTFLYLGSETRAHCL
jgi:hypothetical protein